jgi:colanic acid biosynthesis glycosyl transferase WcaI
MRLLIFSQYYTPEPLLRASTLAPSLVERGHDVTVVTGFPCYPEGKLYPGYKVRMWEIERLDGVQVIRLPIFADHSQSVLRRMAYYGSFAAAASLAVPTLQGRYDVAFVYCTPPTVGVPALFARWLRGIPLVLDVQDLWPESASASGIRTSSALLSVMDLLARCTYRSASAVLALSPGFKRALVAKGVPEGKVFVVPNWADEDTYRPMPRDERLAASLGFAGRFNVVYGGNIGLAQGLRTVIDAAALLRDLPAVQITLVGDGIERPELERLAREKGLTNVRFLGRRPAAEMPSIYALADVLLLHLRRDPLFAVTVPSKTVAYLASGRPILAAVEGDAADIVVLGGAGLVCPPDDPVAMAGLVRAFYATPSAEREAIGASSRQAYTDCFTRHRLVDDVEHILESAARRA